MHGISIKFPVSTQHEEKLAKCVYNTPERTMSSPVEDVLVRIIGHRHRRVVFVVRFYKKNIGGFYLSARNKNSLGVYGEDGAGSVMLQDARLMRATPQKRDGRPS